MSSDNDPSLVGYRPFSETPDIFKALPTSYSYYGHETNYAHSNDNHKFQLQDSGHLFAEHGISNPLSGCVLGMVCQPGLHKSTSSSDSGNEQTAECSNSNYLLRTSSNGTTNLLSPGLSDLDSSIFTELSTMSTAIDLQSSASGGHSYEPVFALSSLACPTERANLNNDLQSVNGNASEQAVWSAITDSLASSLRKKYLKKHGKGGSSPTAHSALFERIGLGRSKAPRRVSGGLNKTGPCTRCTLTLLAALLVTLLLTLLFNSRLSAVHEFARSLFNGQDVPGDPNAVHFQAQKINWHQEAVFYELFVASFKDSDGDGFGDLKGLRSKVGYLKNLGINAVRLNSVFAALDYPYQYEHVINFNAVDPHLGSLDDFRDLVKELHRNKIALVLDISMTVTSDQHPWASAWLTNRSSEHANFYVVNRDTVS